MTSYKICITFGLTFYCHFVFAETNVSVTTQYDGNFVGTSEVRVNYPIPLGENINSIESGRAAAAASPGVLKLASFAQVVSDGLASVGAFASGSANDILFIRTASGIPSQGLLNFNVDLRGKTSIFASSYEAGLATASNTWDFLLTLGSVQRRWSYEAVQISGRPLIQDGSGFDNFVVSIPVSINTQVSLTFFGTSTSGAQGRGGTQNGVITQAGASNDLEHSFYWGGINYLEVGGTKVDFSVTSQSGLDYSNTFAPPVAAIPEPSTISFMLIGLLAICIRGSRKLSVPRSTASLWHSLT